MSCRGPTASASQEAGLRLASSRNASGGLARQRCELELYGGERPIKGTFYTIGTHVVGDLSEAVSDCANRPKVADPHPNASAGKGKSKELRADGHMLKRTHIPIWATRVALLVWAPILSLWWQPEPQPWFS